MAIQRLWKIAPILSTNLIESGIIHSSLNADLTQTAVDAFDAYSKSRSTGTGTTRRNRRTHGQSSRASTPQAQPTGSGITINDYFFEHQRINGYINGTPILSQSQAMHTLNDSLTIQVNNYLQLLGGRAAQLSMLIQSGIISLDLWAAIQRGEGAYHKDHVHEGVLLSGVYYSSVPKGSAPLLLHRPTRPEGDNNNCPKLDEADEVFVMEPKDGQVILFPPWLLHGVPPVDGNKDNVDVRSTRVSFAFNLSGAYAGGDPWDVTR